MKLRSIFYLIAFSLFIASCSSDDNHKYEYVEVATPEIMSKADFRQSVEITAPYHVQEIGKIYAYKNYIFVSDINRGIHVIDNSNPENPKAIKFIKILGNEDISVKNDFLYADSATDLVVFDISNIHSISVIERLKDVFNVYDLRWPNIPFDEVDFSSVNFNNQEEIIVGWTTEIIQREIKDEDDEPIFIDVEFALDSTSAESGGNTGQGGSLARFQIVDDFLYTVGSHEMNIFNIQNLANPILSNTQYAGWNIETMFYADDYLYLGSTNGMYIYGIGNPAAPEYVSEFTHWQGCDPVVVDGDYAYLTLRGGNACGQPESVLEVIDIKNKTNPILAARHTLENPYGLGIKNNTLFICDGTAGLKLFDKTNPLDLKMINEFTDIQSKDVIPLENSLLMIGNNTLYQYEYTDNGVALISTYTLQ